MEPGVPTGYPPALKLYKCTLTVGDQIRTVFVRTSNPETVKELALSSVDGIWTGAQIQFGLTDEPADEVLA
jgi:hypothetical protein